MTIFILKYISDKYLYIAIDKLIFYYNCQIIIFLLKIQIN